MVGSIVEGVGTSCNAGTRGAQFGFVYDFDTQIQPTQLTKQVTSISVNVIRIKWFGKNFSGIARLQEWLSSRPTSTLILGDEGSSPLIWIVEIILKTNDSFIFSYLWLLKLIRYLCMSIKLY